MSGEPVFPRCVSFGRLGEVRTAYQDEKPAEMRSFVARWCFEETRENRKVNDRLRERRLQLKPNESPFHGERAKHAESVSAHVLQMQ